MSVLQTPFAQALGAFVTQPLGWIPLLIVLTLIGMGFVALVGRVIDELVDWLLPGRSSADDDVDELRRREQLGAAATLVPSPRAMAFSGDDLVHIAHTPVALRREGDH